MKSTKDYENDARCPQEGGTDAADARMIERIATGYTPAPLAPTRRVALEDELWTRIDRRRRRTRLLPVVPAFALATAAAVIALFLLPSTEKLKPELPASRVAATTPVETERWELAVVYDDSDSYLDDGLPEDYLGIAVVLADG